jgi:hypothetical protein
MQYLPTIVLVVLFLALLSAQLINNDTDRASLTFLFMILSCAILFIVNHLTGNLTAWILMSLFIIMIVLFSVIRSDLMEIPKVLPPVPQAVPKTDMCVKKEEVCTGISSGSCENVDSRCNSSTPQANPNCIDKCVMCGGCLSSCGCASEGYKSFSGASMDFFGVA